MVVNWKSYSHAEKDLKKLLARSFSILLPQNCESPALKLFLRIPLAENVETEN